MAKILITRLRQGFRTMKYPDGPPPPMPDRFRGRPLIDGSKCPEGCHACAEACPTGAISVEDGRPAGIDLGKCLFCADCASICPAGALSHRADHRLAVRERGDLLLPAGSGELRLALSLDKVSKRLFGRSLKLREVSAGGCNACEADVNVLGTVGWDLGRFGIQFVASPRHADGLLVTGPVTPNMELALRKTYDAVPGPKLVIAVGTCAVSGGLYAGMGGGPGAESGTAQRGLDSLLPVDLYIPGCPPHPLTILDGLLRLLGRLEGREGGEARGAGA